jgi:hypothetical protein
MQRKPLWWLLPISAQKNGVLSRRCTPPTVGRKGDYRIESGRVGQCFCSASIPLHQGAPPTVSGLLVSFKQHIHQYSRCMCQLLLRCTRPTNHSLLGGTLVGVGSASPTMLLLDGHCLANFDDVAVWIAHIAAKLPGLPGMVLRLGKKFGASAPPQLIASPDIGDPDIQEA